MDTNVEVNALVGISTYATNAKMVVTINTFSMAITVSPSQRVDVELRHPHQPEQLGGVYTQQRGIHHPGLLVCRSAGSSTSASIGTQQGLGVPQQVGQASIHNKAQSAAQQSQLLGSEGRDQRAEQLNTRSSSCYLYAGCGVVQHAH